MNDVPARTLFCFDGSEPARRAIADGSRLLEPGPAAVAVVWSRPISLPTRAGLMTPGFEDTWGEIEAMAEGRAAETAASAVETLAHQGWEPEALTLAAPSSVPDELSASAEVENAPVVVVGTHGAGGRHRALLGSVSTALLYRLRRPLLVAGRPPRDGEPETPPEGPVIIGYDASPAADSAISAVARLLRPRKVLVANVWNAVDTSVGLLAIPADIAQSAKAELRSRAQQESTQIAEAGAAIARERGLDAGPLPCRSRGAAWETLLRAASDHDAAAVVVGARGRSRIASTVLGSTSAGVMHHARVPVLVAHETPTGADGQ
ncbi:MAG: universal stress protein [Solirubrobacterales bacterium]